MLWFLTLSSALAGDGPWTLDADEQNLFFGLDYFQYSAFDAGSGDARDLVSPITAMGFTGVWTAGLRRGVEVEVKIPFESARAQDPEACRAAAPVEGWCVTSAGLGDIGGQLKVRVLDELYGRPLTLSLSSGVRTGELYADDRQRLTTLGDGQTDIGGGLSLGRTDVLGAGWYRASVDAWYWRRFDVSEVNLDDEIAVSAAGMVAVWPSWGMGPAVHSFFRLGGLDVGQADFTAPDVWSTLAARQAQVGFKLGVFGQGRAPTFSLTVLRTVWAQNNPTDTFSVSAGLGWFFQPQQEEG